MRLSAWYEASLTCGKLVSAVVSKNPVTISCPQQEVGDSAIVMQVMSLLCVMLCAGFS